MNAVVYAEYGGPEGLKLAQVGRPTPGDDEALVRVVAASVDAGDRHLTRGTPFLVRLIYGVYRGPKFPVLGVDVAGQIEAVGRNATGFEPDDEVGADVHRAGEVAGCDGEG